MRLDPRQHGPGIKAGNGSQKLFSFDVGHLPAGRVAVSSLPPLVIIYLYANMISIQYGGQTVKCIFIFIVNMKIKIVAMSFIELLFVFVDAVFVAPRSEELRIAKY